MLLAMTKPSATGMTCVTPSPLSITVPVSVLLCARFDASDAASASTACTPMYRPATLNDSNMISAVYSRFCANGTRGAREPARRASAGREPRCAARRSRARASGAFSGGSVSSTKWSSGSQRKYLGA